MVFDKYINRGIAIIILHHHTKAKDKTGKGTARGGSSLIGFVNTAYSLHNNSSYSNRRELIATQTRTGEIDNITYDIDIKDKLNEDSSKEYEYIKLTKVEKTFGLTPEQISVLEAMELQEFYTTQELCQLLYENNLYQAPTGDKFSTEYLYKLPDVKKLMPYLDKLKVHDYKDEDNKKIRGNVWLLKKPLDIQEDQDTTTQNKKVTDSEISRHAHMLLKNG